MSSQGFNRVLGTGRFVKTIALETGRQTTLVNTHQRDHASAKTASGRGCQDNYALRVIRPQLP